MKNIYVDIDGTICTNTKPYDDARPLMDRIAEINKLYNLGHRITYWTGRGGFSGIDHTELTKAQLKGWGAKYHDLLVGHKPSFDLYICDKSINSDDYFNPHIDDCGMSHK